MSINLEKTKKRNTTLNFFEIIACIAIIFVHVGFPSHFGVAVNSLVRFGIPLFFVVAGFYLVEDNSTKEKIRKKLIKRIKRMLILIGFSTLLYIIVNIILNVNDIWGYIKVTFTLENLIFFIFFNVPFLNVANWFLFAMLMLIFLFIFLLERLLKERFSLM